MPVDAMSVDEEFSQDAEFAKLLARRRDVNLVVAALEIARDAQPDLSFSHTLEWIARRGDELRGPVAKARNERLALKELARCLSGMHGLHGDRNAFDLPESSYVNRVIETGVGIPISLSVVYMAVADAAGIELSGVATPMHFLTRFDAAEGPLFVDAFHAGQILKYHDCVTWLESISGLDDSQVLQTLEPATPRDIILRMLNNLKALHLRHEQWQQVWRVQRRLSALMPGSYSQQRDLALVALKSNRPGVAIDLLEDCLSVCDEQEKELLLTHLHAAERMLAGWN